MPLASSVVVASLRISPVPPPGTPRPLADALAATGAVEVVLEDDPELLDTLRSQPWCLRAERRWAVAVAEDADLADVRHRLAQASVHSAGTVDDALGAVTVYLFPDQAEAEAAATRG